MAKYTGKTARVSAPASQISAKFADLSVLGEHVDKMPAEHRSKVGDVRFDTDAILIKNPAVGEMAFKIIERNDNRIVFKADGMVPLAIAVNLQPVADQPEFTDVTTVLDIEIPAMLRPLIGGKLQQVADTFGDLITKLADAPTQPQQ